MDALTRLSKPGLPMKSMFSLALILFQIWIPWFVSAQELPHRPSQLMDTFFVHQVDSSPLIIDSVLRHGTMSEPKVYKEIYKIGVILPFQASDTTNGSNNRMASWSTDFYLGFKSAFEEPLTGSAGFEIRVFDSRGNDRIVEDLISGKRLDDLDMIVGPYRASTASIMANWARVHKKLLLSPYTGNNKLGWGNNHYLQMTPGLDRHLSRLLSLAIEKSDPETPIVFLYGDTLTENGKKALWDSLILASSPPFRDRILSKTFNLSELDLSSIPIDTLLPSLAGSIVILPYWEESVVQAVIRKLVAEKADRNVMLLGLPQWLDFQLIQGAHWEALNTHLSSADHFEPTDPQFSSLSRKFRERYAQLLNREVVWGYRCGAWTRDKLERDGAQFQSYLPDSKSFPEHLPIPYFALTRNELGEVVQVVNEAIQILRFQDGLFVPVVD